MKKSMIVPVIPPDARMLAAYDREVGNVETVLVEIRDELRGGGYDATDEQVLNVAFVPGWLESFERGKLATVASPARELLADVAVAKVSALSARLDDLRIQVAGAGFVHDEERFFLGLQRSDIESRGGVLKVSAARRARFVDEHTRVLNDEEAACYIELADILPRLKKQKELGFSVVQIVDGRVGRADWQHGVPGLEGLERDVIKYKYPKIK